MMHTGPIGVFFPLVNIVKETAEITGYYFILSIQSSNIWKVK